jgi:hypothetical protein
MEAVRAMMAGAKESFDLKLQRLIEAGQSQEAERSAGQS